MKKTDLKQLVREVLNETKPKKSWYYRPSPATLRAIQPDIRKFKSKYPNAIVKIDNKEGFIRVNGKIAVDISSAIGNKKEDIFKQMEDTLKKNEEVGLTLPDGTINGDPRGKEDAEWTLPMYKNKEKNISESMDIKSINTLGINFTVLINIGQSDSKGILQLIPKTSKDVDALNAYGKDKARRMLQSKFKQALGFPIWNNDDGSAGLKFDFRLSDLLKQLIDKIK